MAGRAYEATDVYPGMAKTAREEGCDWVAEGMESFAKAEKGHAGRFGQGLEELS